MGIVLAIVIGIVLIGIVLLALGANSLIAKNQKRIADAHIHIEARFGPGDYFVALNPRRAFGIAWGRKGVVFAEQDNETDLLPFDAVRDVTIEVDGMMVTESRNVTKTNRGSQLVSGAVGGALLGPAGILVGGLSGSSKTIGKAVETKNVQSVKLTIRTNDQTHPLRSFVFFKATFGDGEAADGPAVAPALARAEHFHELLTGIIEDRQHYPNRQSKGAIA